MTSEQGSPADRHRAAAEAVAADLYADHIRQLVADAPALSADARDRLAVLLRPAAVRERAVR